MTSESDLRPSIKEIQECLDDNLSVDNVCVRWLLEKYHRAKGLCPAAEPPDKTQSDAIKCNPDAIPPPEPEPPEPKAPNERPVVDGGPAYPCDIEVGTAYPARNGFRRVPHPGMTMRQWYKAAALQGLLAALRPGEEWSDEIKGPAWLAAGIADAMLAEDEEHAKGATDGAQPLP